MDRHEFILEEEKRALRTLPPGSCLVHATNCLGVWGAGIALEIRDIFPAAYSQYQEFCEKEFKQGTGSSSSHASSSRNSSQGKLAAGRCLIIPPQKEDVDSGGSPRGIFVVCLFTSYGYGRGTARKPGRDPKSLIVEQTLLALEDFRSQVGGDAMVSDNIQGRELEMQDDRDRDQDQDRMRAIFSPKFNSGLFGVPWEETAGQIEKAFQGWDGRWIILTL